MMLSEPLILTCATTMTNSLSPWLKMLLLCWRWLKLKQRHAALTDVVTTWIFDKLVIKEWKYFLWQNYFCAQLMVSRLMSLPDCDDEMLSLRVSSEDWGLRCCSAKVTCVEGQWLLSPPQHQACGHHGQLQDSSHQLGSPGQHQHHQQQSTGHGQGCQMWWKLAQINIK